LDGIIAIFMYMDIKKLIKNMIAEVAGVQLNVKRLSEIMADVTIDHIISTAQKRKDILDGEHWNVPFGYEPPAMISGDTWIRTVEVSVEFCNSPREEPTGSFQSSKTKKHSKPESSYSISIGLVVHVPIAELKNERTALRSIFAHELNHAFVFIHDVNKKSAVLNAKNRRIGAAYSEDPGVQLLNKAIYLSNPMEIQARIQDIGGLVDDLMSTTAEDALSELLLYQPMRELSELNNMDFRKIERTQAVQDFARKMGGDDVMQFISDLNRKRKTSAFQALKKVYRLVSDRYSVNEEFWIDAEAYSIIHESDWPPRELL